MKETAVLIGGTFNPFTNAHLEMGKLASKLYPDADIIYVPGNMSFMKEWKDLPEQSKFNGAGRIQQIEQSVKEITNCIVCDLEATGQLDGKSISLVRFMKKEYDKIIFCMGSDKLQQLSKWYEAENFMETVDEILLFARGNGIKDFQSEFLDRWKYKFKEVEFNYSEISSSLIRDLYEKGEFDRIKELVPEQVFVFLRGEQ